MTSRTAKILCVLLLVTLAGPRALPAQTNAGAAVEGGSDATAEGTNAPATVPVPAPPVKAGANAPIPVEPRSETVITNAGPTICDFANHTVLYLNHVLVDAPDFKLRCEWLTSNLPQAGGRVTNIIAETNVVIDVTDATGRKVHATADKAVYVYAVQDGATNDEVTLTNDVVVTMTNLDHSVVTQTGPAFVWNRATDQFIAPGGRTVFQQNLIAPAPDTNPPAAATHSPRIITKDLTAPKNERSK